MTLLAAYNFDEASGAVIDVTGNGHGFTPSGQTVRTASAAGHTDKGLSQTSNSDDDGPTLFGEAASRTLMMWVKTTADFTGWAFEWHHVALDTGLWGLLCLSGNLGFRGRNAGGTTAHASVARPTDNAWHHFAGTYDGTNVRLYVDGTLSATVALSGGIAAATAPAVNAFNTSIMGNQTVIIDDVRLYDTALDITTINTLMGTPVGASTTPVTATRATTWRVLASPTGTRSTTWRVVARTTGSRSTTWDILTPVTAPRSTTWRTAARVTGSRATTWRVRAVVTASRSTTWAVASTLASVTATRATTWVVDARVTSARATTWDTLSLLTNTRSTTWDVLASRISARATTWRVRTQVSASRATTWEVFSNVVARDLTLVGVVESNHWTGSLEANRWAADIEPNRWEGTVPWPEL